MLQTGTKAPEFTLPDQNGELHSLKDYRGKRVLLYFYPRDNTPGCTKQACGYSERYPQFEEKGVVILGISKDSVASHKRFEEKQGLTITLLSDTELEVIQAYDVWKEKKNYGKVSMGVVRTTYLIDEEGVIIQANDKEKAAEDPDELAQAVEKVLSDQAIVPQVVKFIRQYKTKQGINNALNKEFKDSKRTSEIYSAIKPLIADKKGK